MDVLEFIAAMTSALAWPSALVALACVYRKPVVGLLKEADWLEYKGAKLKFRKDIEGVALLIDDLPPINPDEPVGTMDGADTILGSADEGDAVVPEGTGASTNVLYSRGKIDVPSETPLSAFPDPDESSLKLNPAGVIMEVWKELESGARSVLLTATDHVLPGYRKDPFATLWKEGLISDAELDSVSQLRSLRNRAAHGSPSEVTSEDAKRFKVLVDKLILRWQKKGAWRKGDKNRDFSR